MPLASEKFAVVEIIKGLLLNFLCAILYINVASFQGYEMEKKLLLSFLPTWQSIGKLYLFKNSCKVRHILIFTFFNSLQFLFQKMISTFWSFLRHSVKLSNASFYGTLIVVIDKSKLLNDHYITYLHASSLNTQNTETMSIVIRLSSSHSAKSFSHIFSDKSRVQS